MKLKIVISEKWTFYTPCNDDGTSELYSFLENIERKYEADRDGLIEKLRAAANDELGPQLFNIKICHFVDESNRIFQMRHRNFRLLMFHSDSERRAIICAAPFVKRTDKTPPEELKKARDIQQQYKAAVDEGRIVIVPDEED